MVTIDDVMEKLSAIEVKLDALLPHQDRPSGDDLLSVDEVCIRLGISRNAYDRYRKRYPRQFRTAKVGKRRLMRRAALEEFVDFLERIQSRA